jgi:hypothetical protein
MVKYKIISRLRRKKCYRQFNVLNWSTKVKRGRALGHELKFIKFKLYLSLAFLYIQKPMNLKDLDIKTKYFGNLGATMLKFRFATRNMFFGIFNDSIISTFSGGMLSDVRSKRNSISTKTKMMWGGIYTNGEFFRKILIIEIVNNTSFVNFILVSLMKNFKLLSKLTKVSLIYKVPVINIITKKSFGFQTMKKRPRKKRFLQRRKILK